VGADIGYAWGNADVDVGGIGGESFSFDPDGVIGGVFVGYNAQFNQIVVGLEADVEASAASGDDTRGFATADADLNWQGSVRARLGYSIDNFLPYVTGGFAFSDWDLKASNALTSGSDSETFTGWTVGGGLEYAFTQNVIGRVEYRYTDYGDTDIDIGGDRTKFDLHTNAVRIGVSYKF
jgi:outer membrane immunogenic protein